jgi:hypothetical protein
MHVILHTAGSASAKNPVQPGTPVRRVPLPFTSAPDGPIHRAMAKRNQHDGPCHVCGTTVRALEGVLEADDSRHGYRILCPEHAGVGLLDPPRPPTISKLPSIHRDDTRFER